MFPYSGPWWVSPLGVGLTGRGAGPPPLSHARRYPHIPAPPHPSPEGAEAVLGRIPGEICAWKCDKQNPVLI
ncbi:protein of unknown function [Methanoculleus bourgensis]|uniref:Uncharacterized protein n=1 Tax=Methanoculleus bourgensis TaxID=83986 RepID=A0A110BKB0_9EURY|nr:protein of unknown function [Methanoculleus bourgensis]